MFSDSFVNSQEWTLSRNVPEIRLGIVGSLSSGKSALVHRYLTGSYMQEESPEGGRFKKEVVVDGQSYLLLIRDEGGPPELQVKYSDKENTLPYFSFLSVHSLGGRCHLRFQSRERDLLQRHLQLLRQDGPVPEHPGDPDHPCRHPRYVLMPVCPTCLAFCCGYLTFMRAK